MSLGSPIECANAVLRHAGSSVAKVSSFSSLVPSLLSEVRDETRNLKLETRNSSVHPDSQEASANIRVRLDSSTPCANDVIREILLHPLQPTETFRRGIFEESHED